MQFRLAILSAGLWLAATQLGAAGDKLAPADQKRFMASYAKACRMQEGVNKLPAGMSKQLCECFSTRAAKSLTLQDLVNYKLATGADKKKIEAIIDKKESNAWETCKRRL